MKAQAKAEAIRLLAAALAQQVMKGMGQGEGSAQQSQRGGWGLCPGPPSVGHSKPDDVRDVLSAHLSGTGSRMA